MGLFGFGLVFFIIINCWSLNTYLIILIKILFEMLQNRGLGLPMSTGNLYIHSQVHITLSTSCAPRNVVKSSCLFQPQQYLLLRNKGT